MRPRWSILSAGAGAISLGILFTITTLGSGSEAAPPSAPTEAPFSQIGDSIPEPTLEAPISPAHGSETVQKNPSEPYGIGPPDQAWKYESLPTAEKAAVDRARLAAATKAIGKGGVATGAREQSMRARAEAAQHQLGIDALSSMGVVP